MPEGTCNLRIGSAASRNGILKELKNWVREGDGMGRNSGHLLAREWREAIGRETKISE